MRATKQKSAAPTKTTLLQIYKLINQSDIIIAYIFKYKNRYFEADLKVLTDVKMFDPFLMSIDYPTTESQRDLYPLLRELRTKNKGYMLEVQQTGWYKHSFLYGNNIIGASELEPYGKLDIGIDTAHEANVSKFKHQFKDFLSTNSIPIFMFGAMLSAVLKSKLPNIRQDNWGILLVGAGSDGKSTCLELIASWIGNYKSYCLSSNTTRENLEVTFSSFNDLPILADDLGNLKNTSGKSFADIVKSLSQGQTKSYLTQTRNKIRGQKYSSILIATSNSTINDLENIIDDTHDVRLLNIYCDNEYKAFDNLSGWDSPEKLVLHLQTQALNPNPILRVFIEKLIPYLDDQLFWQRYVEEIRQFESTLISKISTDNKLSRPAVYFAQTIAAIDLANRLLNLEIENHHSLISNIYQKWTKTFNSERKNPKLQLNNFILMYIDSKINSLESDKVAIQENYGFYDDNYIFLNSLAISACFPGENRKLLLGQLTYEYKQKKLKGFNAKFYRFDKAYLNN